MAIIVTNDSDLAEPVRLVKTQLRKKIGLLNPQINRLKKDSQGNVDYSKVHYTPKLKRYANFHKMITYEALAQSQFPYELTDKKGSFHKPDSW